MKKAKKKLLSPLAEHVISGLLFGLIFPIVSSIIEIYISDLPLNFNNLIRVQMENPILWIIDLAFPVLGIAGYIAGSKQKELEDQAANLEAVVEHRSQEIVRQKLFYEALVENNPIAIVTLDKEHKILSVNPAFQDMFGYHQEEILGKEIDPLIANPDRPKEAIDITEGVLQGNSMHSVGKRLRKDGSLIDVEIFGQPIKVNHQLIGVLGLYRNITLERQAQEALEASEERFRRMFTDSPIALRVEDLSALKSWMDEKEKSVGDDFCTYLKDHPEKLITILKMAKIIDLNDASLLLFRANDKKELQNNLHKLLSPESHESAINTLCAMRQGKTVFECEMVYQPLHGEKIYTITKLSIVPGYENDWGRVLFSNMDITDRKMAEERLKFISLHDLMTSVYNRAYFEEEMTRLEKGRIFPISILVMDMDNLKTINDRYGHPAGDLALQALADILRNRFRGDDVIARIGGDEFAVLLPGVDEDKSEKMRTRILEGITTHNHQENCEYEISVSIGSATIQKGESLEAAIKLADERMYGEKQSRKESRSENIKEKESAAR